MTDSHPRQPNFFSPRSAAQRYAQARPYFHPLVMERLRRKLVLASRLAQALDVGCGTGQSTIALKQIADRVCGIDCANQMLRLAPWQEGICYVLSPAERLPIRTAAVDLVTVSLAFHWLDQPMFLQEAHRVLRPNGWLVLYDNRFRADMVEDPGFRQWMRDNYGKLYPAPPRNNEPFGDTEARQAGFVLLGEETYENAVPFTLSQLVAYLTTHSNIIAAVEFGRQDLATIEHFLTAELSRFFELRPQGTFRFGGDILYLQRA